MNWILALLALTLLVQVNANPLQFDDDMVDRVVNFLKERGIDREKLVSLTRDLVSRDELLGGLFSAIMNPLEGLLNGAGKFVGGAADGASEVVGGLVDGAVGVVGGLNNILKPIPLLGELGNATEAMVGGAAKGVKNGVATAANLTKSVSEGVSGAVKAIPNMVQGGKREDEKPLVIQDLEELIEDILR